VMRVRLVALTVFLWPLSSAYAWDTEESTDDSPQELPAGSDAAKPLPQKSVDDHSTDSGDVDSLSPKSSPLNPSPSVARPQAAPSEPRPATTPPPSQPHSTSSTVQSKPEGVVVKPNSQRVPSQTVPKHIPASPEIRPQGAPPKTGSPEPLTPPQPPLNVQTIANPVTGQQRGTDTLPKRSLKPSDINLTQPQSQAILAIRKSSNLEQEKRLAEELRQAKADMNGAMIDATPADEVRKKFELVQRKTQELQKQKFERTLKIRDVLTIEQRKRLNELKETH
jgi:Spy/CpxP family protein refolding chaperone